MFFFFFSSSMLILINEFLTCIFVCLFLLLIPSSLQIIFLSSPFNFEIVNHPFSFCNIEKDFLFLFIFFSSSLFSYDPWKFTFFHHSPNLKRRKKSFLRINILAIWNFSVSVIFLFCFLKFIIWGDFWVPVKSFHCKISLLFNSLDPFGSYHHGAPSLAI